jgi:hypothetical protein
VDNVQKHNSREEGLPRIYRRSRMYYGRIEAGSPDVIHNFHIELFIGISHLNGQINALRHSISGQRA